MNNKPFTKLCLLCFVITNRMLEICSISITVYKLTNITKTFDCL